MVEIFEVQMNMQSALHQTAKEMAEKNNIFYLGRGLDYALSMEGSLKLKEISYIHCEGYGAGELKHGTISLIEPGTVVMAIATDDSLFGKMVSNIKEVHARGAYVIAVVKKGKVSSNILSYPITLASETILSTRIFAIPFFLN